MTTVTRSTNRTARGPSRVRRLTVAVATLALVLAACGGNGDTADPPDPGPGTDPGSDTEPPSGPLEPHELLPEPELTSITLGVSSIDPGQASIILAHELDIFSKYGLDVELLTFEGAGRATTALTAGQLAATIMSGGPVLSSQLTDIPLKTVAVFGGSLSYLLVGGPDASPDDDIAGESVAISTFGAVSHVAAMSSVAALGYETDAVQYQQIGSTSARLAALLGGSVYAAPFLVGDRAELEAQGLTVLVDLTELEGDESRIASSTLVMTEAFLDEYPNTALNVMAALIEGINTVFSDMDSAAEGYGRFVDIDVETARQTLEAQLPQYNPNVVPLRAMFENTRVALVVDDPRMENVDPESAYTVDLLRRLEELGFQEALGFPETGL